jgi:hypothetical protein
VIDKQRVPPGVYLYQLEVDGQTDVKKIVVQ